MLFSNFYVNKDQDNNLTMKDCLRIQSLIYNSYPKTIINDPTYTVLLFTYAPKPQLKIIPTSFILSPA